MSFNSQFIASMNVFTLDSQNAISHDFLKSLKQLSHGISDSDVHNNLLLLTDDVYAAYLSDAISQTDQLKLFKQIKVALKHHRSINERTVWYHDNLPTVATIATYHQLITLRGTIISDGIFNNRTDELLDRINYAITNIEGQLHMFALAC